MRRHHRQNLHAGQRADVIDRDHVARVGHGDLQDVAVDLDGQCGVTPAHRVRHQCHRGTVDREVTEFDELHPHLAGERAHQLTLGDHSHLHEGASQRLPTTVLLVDRVHQLVFCEDALLHQNGAQLLHKRPLMLSNP
ncbi:hypothetical protein GCM10025876_39230 [Demequina litorisediminis]|uniref:Uncharacterized protein n=1 Tax=Demequina litorisediminis TaxID=1849022 RepID=A0ABQ6IIK0_9MICO|nr:hypothetical protein GCM10025876_39230 [Demequina litorisediminis]